MKKHTNKTHHRHNNLISPSSLQHPPHLFNTNHTQPLHLTFKTKYSCFSPNHSTPIPNRKVTILTPTKSQSKYNMILYAWTNEKYLIPISVPILPHTTGPHYISPFHKHPPCTIQTTLTYFLSTHSCHYLLLITVSITQPHPKHPLHYTTTLLPIRCQPDTHTNPLYILIHTYNSPLITPLQLLLTMIIT